MFRSARSLGFTAAIFITCPFSFFTATLFSVYNGTVSCVYGNLIQCLEQNVFVFCSSTIQCLVRSVFRVLQKVADNYKFYYQNTPEHKTFYRRIYDTYPRLITSPAQVITIPSLADD